MPKERDNAALLKKAGEKVVELLCDILEHDAWVVFARAADGTVIIQTRGTAAFGEDDILNLAKDGVEALALELARRRSTSH